MSTLQIGDRITTPTGRKGTIAPPPYNTRLHSFITFDDGAQFFILKSILKAL